MSLGATLKVTQRAFYKGSGITAPCTTACVLPRPLDPPSSTCVPGRHSNPAGVDAHNKILVASFRFNSSLSCTHSGDASSSFTTSFQHNGPSSTKSRPCSRFSVTLMKCDFVILYCNTIPAPIKGSGTK